MRCAQIREGKPLHTRFTLEAGISRTNKRHYPFEAVSTTTPTSPDPLRLFQTKSPDTNTRKTHPGFTLSRNAANVPPACGGGGGARFKFCTGDWWIGPGRFRGFADLSIFSEPQTLTKVTCVGKTLSFCGIQIVQEKKIYDLLRRNDAL